MGLAETQVTMLRTVFNWIYILGIVSTIAVGIKKASEHAPISPTDRHEAMQQMYR